mgnify:CR=1 FL=1
MEAVVESAGFGILYTTLRGVVDLTYHFITHEVVERFWDTTNIFYLPFDEMTITPFDFAVLIGLRFT